MPGSDAAAAMNFDVHAARESLRDLFEPDLRRYALDLGVSAIIGWTSYIVALGYPLFSLENSAIVGAGSLAFFRVLNMIHPIFHLPRASRGKFRAAFFVLFGLPLLAPYFLYERSHSTHHDKRAYGTLKDPEYVHFSRHRPELVLGFVLLQVLLPVVLLLRFAVAAPISYVIPPFRRWLVERWSSFTVRRFTPIPRQPAEIQIMRMEEAIVTIYITSLVTAVCLGLVLPQILLQGILLGMILSVMNGIQFLSLHRYKSPDASSHGQLDDTLTLNADNDLLTELWAPVGQGYHALHHLFPQLPYHHMPEAHRRLKLMPANIAYRATESPGLLQTIRALAERSDA